MSDTADPTPRRRSRVLAGLIGLLVLAAALVVVVVVTTDRDDPPDTNDPEPTQTPSQEPSPSDEPTPTAEPGTLISKSAFTTSVPAAMRAWRIVYTTTDQTGRPDTATATVLAARGKSPGPRPVIGVGHGTVGTASRCAPSLSDRPFTTSVTALAALVEQGWVAVTSDYAGLGSAGPHPYLVGKAEAHDVLDAVRAAHEVLELSPKTLLMGNSQGGHAALWAGIEAPAYAPELEVIGVAAAAPATDLHALVTQTRDTMAGTLIGIYLLDSWEKIYPEAGLARQVQKGAGPVIDQASRLCLNSAEATQAFGLAQTVVGSLVSDGAYDGELGRLLRANTPTGRIEAPVLVAQGLADALVLPGVQQEWVAQRCRDGQAIDYREYAGHTHSSLVQPSSPLMDELVQWARDRLAGKPARDNCG